MPNVEQYQSALTGPQMDQALLDMANHTSERYAKGTEEGVPVSPGTVGYEDNALHYKNQAAAQAAQAQQAVTNANVQADRAATAAAAAEASENNATVAAAAAAAEADRAEDAADRAEAIVGGQYVSYGQPQGLNDTQKAQARENIGAEISEEKTATPGAIVTFNDGAAAPLEALEVELAIDQDLNGYPYPWPAGGGKNLIRYPYPSGDGTYGGLTFSSAADGTLTVTGTISSSVVFQMATGLQLPAGQYTLSTSDTGGLNVGVYDETAAGVVGTAPLTFTADPTHTYRVRITKSTQGLAVNATIRAQLEAGATATSWVPYSNVCPITPHTAVNITKAGKNLLQFAGSRSHNGVDFTLTSNGSMLMTGTATDVAYAVPSNAQRTILPAGTYKISGGLSSSIWLYISGTYEDGTALPPAIDTGNGADVTYTKNASVYFQIRVATGTDTTGKVIFPMLRLASIENDTYEACNKQIYTVELGGEYYAGELDVTSGQLTVKYASVDLGTLNYTANSARTYFYTSGLVGIAKGAANQGTKANIYAEKYQTTTRGQLNYNPPTVDFCVSMGGNAPANLQVRDTSLPLATMTAAEFKAAMAGVKLVYELDTPQVIQLTPTEVQALNGYNTIWADSGDILALAYRTKGSIQLDDFAALLEETTAGAGTSNRDLLHNGSFLINQRGVNGTLSNGYGPDCWIIFASGGSVSYDATAKTVTLNATSNVAYLQQKVEDDLRAALDGKTVTFSVLTTDGIVYKNTFTYDASAHDSGPYFPDNPKLRFWYGGDYALCLRVEAAYEITIKRIKLELGDKSTIANDVPDIAAELAACQRYGTGFKNNLTGGVSIASSVNSSDTYVDFILPLPATLSKSPTVTTTGSLTVFNPAGYYYTITSITMIASINNMVYLRCYAPNLVANTVYRLTLGAGSQLYISADL